MAIQLTADRIRSIISGAKDEKAVLSTLKHHRVRFNVRKSPEGCAVNIFIPCKTGKIRIYRTCSRSAPFMVQHLTPVQMEYSKI